MALPTHLRTITVNYHNPVIHLQIRQSAKADTVLRTQMSASGPAFGALYTSDQLPHNGRTDIGLASARGDLEEVERSVLHGHAPPWVLASGGHRPDYGINVSSF